MVSSTHRSWRVFAYCYLIALFTLSACCHATMDSIHINKSDEIDRDLIQTWPTRSPVKSPPKKKPDHKEDNNSSSSTSSSSSSSSSSNSSSSSPASLQSQSSASSMMYVSGAIMVGAAIAVGVNRQRRTTSEEKQHPLTGSIAKRAGIFAVFAGKAKGVERPPREIEFELRDDASGFGLDDSGLFA